MVNLANAVFAEATAFEADGIQSVGTGATFGGGFREGKDVARDRRPAADESVRADAHEVVHRAQRADRGPILDDDMAAQGGGVGHDYMIADGAIVSDVGVGHEEIVTADAGEASAFDGAAIDGDELANEVVVADFEARGFAVVADILRREADGRKRKEAIMGADFRWAIDGDVRDQFAGFAEFDVCADGAVGADFAGWSEFSRRGRQWRWDGLAWLAKGRPCRDSVLRCCSPGNYAPGFHIPPLRGWSIVIPARYRRFLVARCDHARDPPGGR